MKKLVLALPNELSRRLVSISHSGIYFNLTGYMTFSSEEEISTFLEKWKNHFFNKHGSLYKLVVVEDHK